jgi:hypothetical protein
VGNEDTEGNTRECSIFASIRELVRRARVGVRTDELEVNKDCILTVCLFSLFLRALLSHLSFLRRRASIHSLYLS